MKQFSSTLHTENNKFKKQFLRLSLLLFLIVLLSPKTNAQCDVNPVANQVVCNNTATTAINFTGTATTFNWINNNISIGLAASGTGNIASFTAVNLTATTIIGTITVTPSTGACTGTPVSFTITVNPSPVVSITPSFTCGGVAGLYGVPLVASAAGPPVPGSVTVNSGILNLSIPDNTANGVSNNIILTGVPVNATITNVSVTLNLPHTYPADMIINLKAPNGLILSLYKHNTNTNNGAASIPTAGFYNAVVSSTAVINFVSVPTPFRYGQSAPAGPYRADALNGITNPAYTIMDPAGFVSNASSFASLISFANGNWTLAMADGGRPGDIGILASWSLTIDYTAPGGSSHTFIWSPLAGLYTNSTTTAPYTGTNTPLVYAAPTAFTIYTVTGTNIATGCIGTATTAVNYTPPAPVITPLSVNMCIGDPAVKLKVTAGVIPTTPATWSPISGLFSNAAATIPYIGNAVDSVWVRPVPAGVYTYQVTTQGLPVPPVSFTNPAPITINAVGTATPAPANVSVSGLPISGVTVQSVNINGFNHSWAGNVNLVLQSPVGQNVILMANSNANPLIAATNVNLTFSDVAAGSLPTTSPMASGTYLPTNRNGATFAFLAPGPTVTGPTFPASPTLATFLAGNMNGTWKLFVEDRVAGNQGNITGGFTISFNIPIAPCTSPPRSVTARVLSPATITSQPANQALCTGGVFALFSASLAGTGPFNFQWQVSTDGGTNWNNTPNGGAYSGSTTATLTISPVTAGMNGNLYRLLINGGTGCSVTSNAALLTINPLPTAVITANPLVIGPAQTSTISSTVTANPAATYAWYYNGSVLPGEVAATLLVNYGSPGDYQLKLTNVCGVGLSNIITIANSFALGLYSYPNPSGGIFQVIYQHDPNNTTNNTLQRSLTVYNNWGGKIITRNFAQTTNYQKIDIDVRAHGKCIFWVEMRDANGKRLGMNRVVVQ